MIRLDIEEYCEDCPYFEAECDTIDRYADQGRIATNTVVRCRNKDKCLRIEEHIRKRIGKGNA